MDALLAEARTAGTRASVSALAERAGITRPTLYRNFPGVIARLRAKTATAASHAAAPRNTPMQDLRDRITSLRTENEQLRLHVELYEEHIRRLTIENARLASELARHESVTDLANHRHRPSTP